MLEAEYPEYRCTACKKEVKNIVLRCKVCMKAFFHPGCILRDKEVVRCEGPFEEISLLGDKTEVRKPSVMNKTMGQTSMDDKIERLIAIVKRMREEVAGKDEIKTMIRHIIQEEIGNFKQELEDIKQAVLMAGMRGDGEGEARGRGSYSEVVREGRGRGERVLIVKPKMEQSSEVTRKVVKEKIDIKNIPVGITKLKKGGKGAIILGCESEKEVKKLKETVCENLGEDFVIVEPKKTKPKIKIMNIEEEEIKMKDEELIEALKNQNAIDGTEDRFCMKIVKRIDRKRGESNMNARTREREGILIMEVDEITHETILRKGKINIGWRKCLVYDHYSVKRCYKCWGYHHIAINCTRQETCHKCAGNHRPKDCNETKKKCTNCMHKNRTYNLKIDEEHDALSRECPTYIRILEEEKRRTGRNMDK